MSALFNKHKQVERNKVRQTQRHSVRERQREQAKETKNNRYLDNDHDDGYLTPMQMKIWNRPSLPIDSDA